MQTLGENPKEAPDDVAGLTTDQGVPLPIWLQALGIALRVANQVFLGK